MGERIAGHSFTEEIGGMFCDGCRRRLRDITGVRRENIGQDGWAHYGHLTEGEYLEIIAYNDRIWQSIVDSSTTN